ncbi:MAG: nickel-dependent hydrogenase large subunit [Sutterellaceae bacterium]|nr:nickel-dependent hydrogenase large subunit [Sutterellaceae bacterium]MDD7443072.1 nickel-dependent hydrogenase large subunit [Sutterellaceae bacterium]MDY2869016.1 nickel-dependent hydrogenase large subunit [Mesosutterella sp.]
MSETRIVVDPLTRIEGHLRVQAVLGSDGKISDAMSTGTMWRGLEVILKGRDPRDAWAFVERICGVCTGIHALAAVRAVEDAIGIKIPKNANIIRNLMNATLYTQDHVTHFYQLHALDWVDVVSALNADPRETAAIQQKISPNHVPCSAAYFADVQRTLKEFVATGQLSIFKNGYWGHPAMKLPPAVNLLATAHYLEALDFQREVIKIHTILGGKNPHPNYLVGGVPCPINMSDTGSAGNGLNATTMSYMKDIAKYAKKFVEEVYIPDVKAVASFYPEWFKIGGGIASKNLVCFGEFPEIPNQWDNKSLVMPMGAIVDGDLKNVQPVDPKDPKQIQEFVDHSWFKYAGGDDKGLHPFEGESQPNYVLPEGAEGERTKFKWLTAKGKYSWVKAPKWRGHMMEVGPLARVVMGVALGTPVYKDRAEALLKELNLPLEAVFSTLGRTAARAIDCDITANLMGKYVDDLIANVKAGDEVAANMEKWEPSTWPKECKGVGLCEAPRGALSHFCVIKDGKLANWQAVVPTTWNAAPRDNAGQKSAFETSLIGTPIADPKRPVEILRTIHSFDPCLACASHLFDANGTEITKVDSE